MSAVQFSSVGIAAVVAQPSKDSQASAKPEWASGEGPGGIPGEVLDCTSLSEAKISEDSRPTSVAQLVLPASQARPPPQCIGSYLYSLQTSHVLHRSSLSTKSCLCTCVWLSKSPCESALADINLLISLSLQKQQETIAKSRIFWRIFLCGVLTNGAQLLNGRGTIVVSKEPFITCSFTCLFQ